MRETISALATEKQSSMRAAMTRLENAVGRNSDLTERLRKQLEPVSVSRPGPANAVAQADTRAEQGCAFAISINGLASSLEGACDELQQALNELEL